MICRASNPYLSSTIVFVVALIEWFVYTVDNSSCCDITFIFFPRVFSPTTMLSYQTGPLPDDFSHWNRNLLLGFKWLRYFSKENTGRRSHRLLSSYLLLQLERRVLCDFLLVHPFMISPRNVIALGIDNYFKVSLFQLAQVLSTTATEKLHFFREKPACFVEWYRFSLLKTAHWYSFFMHSSAIGSLC